MGLNKNKTTFSKNSKKKNCSFSIEHVSCFFILLITFVMIYILNKNTHFTSDDFRYHFMYESFFPAENVSRITNLKDIFHSMYNHYFMWGGRITAHTLVQLILIFNKNIFNIVNSLFFVGLAVLIYMHCNVNKKINITLLIGIILSLFFFIPQFGLTVLWVSGAGNYLWCAFIILLFLLPYRVYVENNKNQKKSIFKFIYMILLGIIAGWTNENTGGAMILLIMLFILYYKLHNIKIPKWAVGGFISSAIGFMFLILAPGNNARKGHMIKKTVNLIDNILNVLGTTSTLCGGLVILLIVFLLLLSLTNKDKKIISKQLILSGMYLICALAGIIVMIVSPQIAGRVWFGPITFIIISTFNLYPYINRDKYKLKIIISIFLIIFGLKFIQDYKVAYNDITKTFNSINYQISTIIDEKEKGNLDIQVKSIEKPKSKYNAFLGTRYLSSNKDSWLNQWMAKYYDINSIEGVKNEKKNFIDYNSNV